MSISAIVPVWNGREHLARLLDSLDTQTVRPDEVIAVDNGSTDGAPDLAQSRGARVIAMGRNAGFAAAVNRGIQEACGEWVAILKEMKLESDGMAFSEEIKIEALRNSRIRFGEISIQYSSRLGETKLNAWRDGFANLAFLLKKRFFR